MKLDVWTKPSTNRVETAFNLSITFHILHSGTPVHFGHNTWAAGTGSSSHGISPQVHLNMVWKFPSCLHLIPKPHFYHECNLMRFSVEVRMYHPTPPTSVGHFKLLWTNLAHLRSLEIMSRTVMVSPLTGLLQAARERTPFSRGLGNLWK